MTLKRFSKLFSAFSRRRIDDAAFAFMGANETDQSIGFVTRFRFCAEGQIGPIKARHMQSRGGQVELLKNVRPGPGIGRRCHGQTRDTGKSLFQPTKRAIVRAKIMSPLANAVGFIDSD